MQFKVGDRVEVLKSALGVKPPDLNYVGAGTIEGVDEASAKVRVDANEKAWWYALGDIRHAVEEIEIHPTPSITVGTQVRLTGVVTGADGSGNLTVVLGEDFEVWIHPNKIPLEVIRQPFKRGEVVWFADAEIPCVVVEDESDNRVLLTECGVDKPNVYVETRHYERRP